MPESASPRISAILPLHNGRAHVAEALESMVSQTRKPDEILVVDDGSTDGGHDVVESFPEVRLIRQECGGVAAARNVGLANTTGEYLTFLDQDDIWYSDKTEKQLALLEAHPEAWWVMAWEACELVGDIERPFWLDSDHLAEPHLAVHPGTMMMRRGAFETFGDYDTRYRFNSDMDWVLRTRRLAGQQLVMEEPVIRKRIHEVNESRHHREMNFERMVVLRRLKETTQEVRHARRAH